MDGDRVDWLGVEEAAERLGVGPSQVRRLARDGQLPARRVGSTWLIDEAGIERRRDLEPSVGRPLSPPMAWAVLHSVDAALVGGPANISSRSASEVPIQLGDRKERYRLRRLLSGAPPVNRWDAWLRQRAVPRRIWVHPGVVDRLAANRRVRPGGAPAVAAAGLGLSGADRPSLFYVDAEDSDAVVAKYRGHDDPDGPLTLMVIPPEVPSALRPLSGAPTPPAVALVDLLGSSDARQHDLATELLGAAAARLAKATPR
jgi:excisionase family DNA binding protein